MIDSTRRKNYKKVWLHIVPAHAAKTAHLGKHGLLIDFEFDSIPNLDIQPARIIIFDRDIAGSSTFSPPVTIGYKVVAR